MSLQLLHFHAVFKTWPTFQELTFIAPAVQKIETYRVTKVKICLVRYKDYEETFFLPPHVAVAVLVC